MFPCKYVFCMHTGGPLMVRLILLCCCTAAAAFPQSCILLPIGWDHIVRQPEVRWEGSKMKKAERSWIGPKHRPAVCGTRQFYACGMPGAVAVTSSALPADSPPCKHRCAPLHSACCIRNMHGVCKQDSNAMSTTGLTRPWR